MANFVTTIGVYNLPEQVQVKPYHFAKSVAEKESNNKLYPQDSAKLESLSKHAKDSGTRIKEALHISQRSLHFSLDGSTGKVIIEVIDPETGEIVRKIPQEKGNTPPHDFSGMSGVIIDQKI